MTQDGFINVLIPLSSRQVTFQNLTETSVPLEDISIPDDDQLEGTRTSHKPKTTITSHKASIVSLSDVKLVYHKLAVAFGICCILILFLSPIVLYYAEDNRDRDSSTTEIGNINVSKVTNSIVYCLTNTDVAMPEKWLKDHILTYGYVLAN